MSTSGQSREQKIWYKIQAGKAFEEIVKDGFAPEEIDHLMDLHLKNLEKSLSRTSAIRRSTKVSASWQLSIRCMLCETVVHSIGEARMHLDKQHPIPARLTESEIEAHFEKSRRFWKWFIKYQPQGGK